MTVFLVLGKPLKLLTNQTLSILNLLEYESQLQLLIYYNNYLILLLLFITNYYLLLSY